MFIQTVHVYAAPQGGVIRGGSGSISKSELTTLIQQNSDLLAIDWGSFDISADERVNFIQPGLESIALNRVLSNNPSRIFGQLNANGHVILANPHGIHFGNGASVNVGGLIAAGMDIDPDDFMNRDFTFSALEGTDGNVVNRGLIHAATGGSVGLLGRQVENDGLIVANLGAVYLAAGTEAVATFDGDGLLGIKVTEAVLQDELGVDPAVLNSGEIRAHGGRVVMSAGTSRDLFSSAVNTGDLKEATSVVVHEDGSFTLDAGADTENTGTVDVSTTEAGQNAGQVVMLGETVTHSGAIRADAAGGQGGNVELHATDTTLLIEDSRISARSEANGTGGTIKALGERVGLFDQSQIDVSGAVGGGRVFIGGGYQGNNPGLRNAQRTYVGEGATVYADALDTGDGGTAIVWADEVTRFYGSIYARSGIEGDGGFAEVSGKESLDFAGFADLGSVNGEAGSLLLDPNNITITDGGASTLPDNPGTDPYTVAFNSATFTGDMSIDATEITDILGSGSGGSAVILQAKNNIFVNESILAASNENSLTLEAANDITIISAIDLGMGDLSLIAGSAGCDSCNVVGEKNLSINAPLDTEGAIDLIAADNVTISDSIGNTSTPSSLLVRAGNNAIIDDGTSVTTSGNISLTAADASLTSDPNTPVVAPSGTVTGDIIVEGSIETGGGAFIADGASFTNWAEDNDTIITGGGSVTLRTDRPANGAGVNLGRIDTRNTSGTDGALTITANGAVDQSFNTGRHLTVGQATVTAPRSNVTLDHADNDFTGTVSIDTSASESATGQDGGAVTLNDTNSLILGDLNTSGGDATGDDQNGGDAGGVTVTFNNNLTLNGALTARGGQPGPAVNGTPSAGSDGAMTVTGDSSANIFTLAGTAVFDAASVSLSGGDGADMFNIENGATVTGGTDVSLDGNADSAAGIDTVRTVDGPATWTLTGNDDAILALGGNTFMLTEIEALSGGAGNDIFELMDSGNYEGTVTGGGGAGTDTVIAGARDSEWTVTGPDSGNATGLSNAFSGIEVLQGQANFDDTFNLPDTATFAGELRGGAGTGTDTVAAGARDTTWTLIGTGAGNATGLSGTFAGIEVLQGRDNFNDTFNLPDTAAVTGELRGGVGSGTDTVAGGDRSADWNVLGDANGTLTGDGALDVTFSEMEHLLGGADNDDFIVGVVSAMALDGGAAGTDTVNATNLGPTIVEEGDINSSFYTDPNNAPSQVRVNRINTLTAADGSTLRGADLDRTWTITGEDTGTTGGMTFNGFTTLVGGNRDDRFQFQDETVNFEGDLFGGSSQPAGNGDEVDFSALDAITVNVNATGSIAGVGITGFDRIASDNINSTLNGVAGTEWTLNSDNAGAVDFDGIDGVDLQFRGFNILNAGDATDTFTLTLNADLDPAVPGVQINGGASLTLDGGDTGLSETYTPGADADAGQLAFSDGADTYTLAFDNTGGVNDTARVGSFTVQGGADADTLRLWADRFSLTGGATLYDAIGYANKNGFRFNGGGNIDIVLLEGAANPDFGTGIVQFNAESLRQNGSGRLSAGELILEGGATAGAAPLLTAVERLRLRGTGVVQLDEADNLELTEMDADGRVTLNAAGSVTAPAALTARGGLTVNAGGDLRLSHQANRLAGPFDLRAGGSVVFNNARPGVNRFNRLEATALTLDVAGDLEADAAFAVAGRTELTAGGDIRLTGNGIDLQTLAVNSAEAVAVEDAGNLTLAALSADGHAQINAADDLFARGTLEAGQLSLTAGGRGEMLGAITTPGALEVTADRGLSVGAPLNGGDISLDAGSGTLDLTGAVTAAGNLRAEAGQGIGIDAVLEGQTLTVIAGGAIDQRAGLIAADSVALDSSGAITMADNVRTEAGTIAYTAGADIDLNVLEAGNDLSLTADGAIVDINADAVNLIAPRVAIDSVSGIGAEDNPLELQTGELDAINSRGLVNLRNTGDVTLARLHNRGDLELFNDGDLNVSSASVDAGRDTGSILMTVTNGSLLGLGPTPDLRTEPADITGYNGTFLVLTGAFGSPARPITLDIQNELFMQALTNFVPLYPPGREPNRVADESVATVNAVEAVTGLTGSQLIEIESVSEIDPAVFTEIRNFNYAEIAIRLPSDQLYDDELEEYRLRSDGE